MKDDTKIVTALFPIVAVGIISVISGVWVFFEHFVEADFRGRVALLCLVWTVAGVAYVAK